MFAFRPLLRLFLLALALPCAASSSSTTIRVGLLSEPRLRVIEELCLVGLQTDPALEFLERSQLSLLAEELSLGQVLGRAGWNACDALVLFNTFSGRDHAAPSLIVRIVSTRDLKILGLWVYPLLEQSPEKIAERLVPRLGPALARASTDTPRTVVSLALLRADEPRLSLLAEPATYQLAATLASYPGIVLVERWNVRDPAFEQWLRQTQPTDVRPPDILVGGALSDLDGRSGLRLEINGAESRFAASPERPAPPLAEPGSDSAPALAPALAAAARAIVGTRGAAPPPAEQEIRRHEQDARWFWKWSAFAHAAAAADTALFLGSKNPETAYIRALANLRQPRAYASNLGYTDTPSPETLARALYGLDCLLRIPEPPAKSPLRERLPHLRYLEQAVQFSGVLLHALYFSRETLPGTPGELAELRRLAAELTDRAWTYHQKLQVPRNSYAPILEHIDPYGLNFSLATALLDYAAFSTPDASRLAKLQTECLAELARRQLADESDQALPMWFYGRLRQRAWYLDWSPHGRPPAERASAQALLLEDKRPAVRLLAGLLPLLCRPSEHPRHKALVAAWLADLAHRWSAESDFFLSPDNLPLALALLGNTRQLLEEQRELLGDRFPAAEWHRVFAALAAKAPERFSAPRHLGMRNLLLGLETTAAQWLEAAPAPGAASASSPLPAERRARTYALLLEARPTDTDAARRAASEQLDSRRAAWRERVAATEAARPAPRLVFESTPRPLVRVASPDGGPADRLEFSGPRATFVAATQDETGSLWLLSCAHRALGDRDITLIWRQLDPTASTLLREIRLEHSRDYFFNAHHHAFHVRAGRVATALRPGLHLIDLSSRTMRVIETAGLQSPRIWFAADHLWITGRPGVIYQHQPATDTLALISSAMRSPPQNRLDARDAYEVTSLFAHEGKLHAWIDGTRLHVWDPASRDWRETYSTRDHWSPGRPYPLGHILAALGTGLSAGDSQESIFRLLRVDPTLSGRFGAAFSTADHTSGEPLSWPSAAHLGDRVWTFQRTHAGAHLVSKQLGSGRTERHLLGRADYDGLHAFDTGLLFADTQSHQLYHIPRQRLDPAYSPPPPAPSPPLATPATAPPGSPIRTLRSASGQTIEAEILGYFGESVTLRRADGRMFTVEITRFSAEDLAYLREDRRLRVEAASGR